MKVGKFSLGLALVIFLVAAVVIHALGYLGFLLALIAAVFVGILHLERVVS